jgi:hypothetical protein
VGTKEQDLRRPTAQVEILNLDGALQGQKSTSVDSPEDSVQTPIKLEYPAALTPVHCIRLKLTQGGDTLSQNFYWRGLEQDNYRALRQLPKVRWKLPQESCVRAMGVDHRTEQSVKRGRIAGAGESGSRG